MLLTKFLPMVCLAIKVELPGFDGNGGSSYVGSGCFHRRETLRGQRYNKEHMADWKNWINKIEVRESASVLEETCNVLASCTYEENNGERRSLSLSLSPYEWL